MAGDRVTAEAAAKYLSAYIDAYRREHDPLTEEPPTGAGFPKVVTSPYLSAPVISCLLASDGAAVVDFSREPPYDWWLAGGPAIMVDDPDPSSRVPAEIVELLKREGVYGKNIGVYRVCFPNPADEAVWAGTLPEPIERATAAGPSGTMVEVNQVDLTWRGLIERLTFGAYGAILDLHLPEETGDLWQPYVVRDLGFMTADRSARRFFHYLELLRHVDTEAWDRRSIWARVKLDVRRDLAHAIAMAGSSGATMSFGMAVHDVTLEKAFGDRLEKLESSIAEFERLLGQQADADESVYQAFLTEHPLLLDIYGEVIPKPNFVYPEGSSPLGKTHVQPDFIIRRPGDRYRLVEIERPSKLMATKAGQSRAEVGQASFQIGEFTDFITEHYDVLKDEFPGINRNPESLVVISRSRSESFGGRGNVTRQLQLLQQQHSGVELITYDDLLERARAALLQLSGISSSARRGL